MDVCESGDLYYRTMDQNNTKDLDIRQVRSHLTLYILMKEGLVKGLSDGKVDD